MAINRLSRYNLLIIWLLPPPHEHHRTQFQCAIAQRGLYKSPWKKPVNEFHRDPEVMVFKNTKHSGKTKFLITTIFWRKWFLLAHHEIPRKEYFAQRPQRTAENAEIFQLICNTLCICGSLRNFCEFLRETNKGGFSGTYSCIFIIFLWLSSLSPLRNMYKNKTATKTLRH